MTVVLYSIILASTHIGFAVLGQSDAATATGLTIAGAFIMIASIAMVIAFLTFCMYRILREPNPQNHHHAPLDIDTKDDI